MSVIPVVYSGKDMNFVLVSPLTGVLAVAGVAALGVESVELEMLQERSVLKVGMDGAVIISSIPGDQARITIRVWQTSILHQGLVAWYNALVAAQSLGDVTNWAASTITVTNLVNPIGHYLTGVCPLKLPTQVYHMEAETYQWTLLAGAAVTQ